MSWYVKGKKGLEIKKKKEKENRNKISRFWLRPKEEALIIFVDDDGFFCDVHQFKLNGKWNNFATCVRDVQPCPICEAGYNPTWTAHYTVIDTREFEFNGTTYKNRKVLFPAKGDVIQIIADLKEKYGSLVGRAFKVKRYGEKEVNTGSHFEYVGKVKSLKKYGDDADKPFDYLEILKPPTKEQYKEWGFVVPEELGELDDEDIIPDEVLTEADYEDEEEEIEEKPKKKSKKKAKKSKPKKVEEDIEFEDEEEDIDTEIDEILNEEEDED